MGAKIENLPQTLFTPDRQFAPRTPHSYAHTGELAVSLALLPGELATVHTLYEDLPEVVRLYPAVGESE